VDLTFDSSAIFEVISVLVIVAIFVWRMPSKGDIQRIDDRIDKLDTELNNRIDKLDLKLDKTRIELKADIESLAAKTDVRFTTIDSRMEDARKETKADLQRLEDRADRANEYHARSVELLDAIRRELEDRRERL